MRGEEIHPHSHSVCKKMSHSEKAKDSDDEGIDNVTQLVSEKVTDKLH
jgi:hypothetical protein